jgi:hypothetical protein
MLAACCLVVSNCIAIRYRCWYCLGNVTDSLCNLIRDFFQFDDAAHHLDLRSPSIVRDINCRLLNLFCSIRC